MINEDELIAGFMKLERVSRGHWTNHGICRWIEDGLEYPELRYKTSWDWLMPVVTKIFSLNVTPSQERSAINDALNEANINSIYEAVVDFIKWYNSVER